MRKISIFIVVIFGLVAFIPAQAASSLAVRLSGRILLAVEQKGEAWYVNPSNFKRYYLGRPADALNVMRQLGIGITNADLEKIPLADLSAPSSRAVDLNFAARQKGRIFLQVQAHGEAWYVNPLNNKRYYLGRPENAFALMRFLGLGISNFNLAQIVIGVSDPAALNANPVFVSSPYDLGYLEWKINSLVNDERLKAGLPVLKWNADIAAVAREHSQNLAEENKAITALDKPCDYFMIHHEGLTFGLYQNNRLNSRGIYYFSYSGENIAMQGGKEITYQTYSVSTAQAQIAACSAAIERANSDLKAQLEGNLSDSEKMSIIQAEITERKAALAAEPNFDVIGLSWTKSDELAAEIVDGWMNSPGHRANILRGEYDEAGIGVAYVNGYIIATQDFIQRASCGFWGGTCCAQRGCYVPLTCQPSLICQ